MPTEPDFFTVEDKIELCRHFMSTALTLEEAREWWRNLGFWVRWRRGHKSAVEDIEAGVRL